MRLTTKDLIDETDYLTSTEVKGYISNIGYYVYFLVDPFTFQIKYIGKGIYLRALDHYNNCEDEVGLKATWLRKLKKRDKEPLYVIWESYGFTLKQENLAYQQEKNFIDSFGRKGIDRQGTLLNKSNKLGVPLILKTTEQFIKEAKLVHGDLYDYRDVDYFNAHEKVKIYCKVHKSFMQTPDSHLQGSGCRKCGNKRQSLKSRSNTEEFAKKANIIHKGKYDYSEVNYIRAIDKVNIICKEHGKFEQSPNKHLDGNGCPKCGLILKGVRKQKQDTVINQFKAIHGSNYDYSKVIYKYSLEKVLIGCKQCNKFFNQTPAKHKSGQGCPNCKGSKISESLHKYFDKEKDLE